MQYLENENKELKGAVSKTIDQINKVAKNQAAFAEAQKEVVSRYALLERSQNDILGKIQEKGGCSRSEATNDLDRQVKQMSRNVAGIPSNLNPSDSSTPRSQ